MKLRIAAAALFVLGATNFAQANSGTQLPFSQYQAGTETTSSALVTNGNFELPGSPNPNPNPTGWLPAGQMNTATPLNPPSPTSTVGNFAAQSGGQPTPANPNRYSQIISGLAPNTDYVLSAYLWNFGSDFDLAIAELVDTGNETNSVTLAQSRHTDNFDDASTGTFVYLPFNSSQFATNPRLDVEFDFDEDVTDPRPAIVAQIDNVSITPAVDFHAPTAIPEPTSLAALAGLGLLGLARRRSTR